MSRCTGHCCKRFNLSLAYEELIAVRDALRKDEKEYVNKKGFKVSIRFQKEEVEKVCDMLIPLETSSSDLNGQTMIDCGNDFQSCSLTSKQIGEVVVLETEWFTCKHFDPGTNNCMDYENRPLMCQSHGTKRCGYKACTYREGERRGKESLEMI